MAHTRQPTPLYPANTVQVAQEGEKFVVARGHGAWALERLLREEAFEPKSPIGQWVKKHRFDLALSLGYPSYNSAPKTAKMAITIAVTAYLQFTRMSEPVFKGEDPPEHWYKLMENLRRLLQAMGAMETSGGPSRLDPLALLNSRSAKVLMEAERKSPDKILTKELVPTGGR